jgi:hypothetical protein
MKNIVAVAIMLNTVLFFSCDKDEGEGNNDNVMVIKATVDIQPDVDAFKNMLGPLNTTPDVTGGHREINWDAVPDSLLNKPLPDNFFNQTGENASTALQKGITYTPGNFVVSNNQFAFLNSDASTQFSAFSGTNTFANTTVSRWDVSFQRAGTTESAFVQAFGLVFSDVDKDNSTSVEFFEGNTSLGKYFVPAHDASSSFSFLGVNFQNNRRVTKVTVIHDGFLAEGARDVSDGGTRDLIVLDDFIYSEPVVK